MLDLLTQMGRPSGQIRLVLNRVGARGSLSLAETAGIFDRPFAVQLPDDTPTTNYALPRPALHLRSPRDGPGHAVDILAALFVKGTDNRQLDFLKSRVSPRA